ncbi:recombinase family protein, partial [Acidiphilium sp.]|uniref:recombinase family protein n=1 Tax=Acidiphilium sp. TaxID=527 RepID=UPI00258F1355
KPAPFDVVVVHSFSRFFRDHFELEFYVRKLAKNGVKLVSITQEMGDDPMHVMMRQIMAPFDEYQSKENARQGFWSGSLPPIGSPWKATARPATGTIRTSARAYSRTEQACIGIGTTAETPLRRH